MGLLVEGQPMTPEELVLHLKYIRHHGVIQFLNIWKRLKDVQNDELKFGDEIECGVFTVDHVNKTVKLSVRAAEIRKFLSDKEHLYEHETEGCTWHPEYGGWMVESTPSRPYSGYAADLLRVERSMVLRRRRLLAGLKENEIAPTVTCFPMMGVGDFINAPLPFEVPYSQSEYVPDYVINPHPRFAALTRNIRARRGEKVNIKVPLFKDENTPEFSEDPFAQTSLPSGYKFEEDKQIHMDCMAFGMGMCCLQVTFQARDVDESRYMYDQLAVLAPIMMAMTAATPIFKGRLADIDARWTVISQSVDDRTAAERGLIPDSDLSLHVDERMAGNGVRLIPKSRYDSISTYIYHCKGEPACQRTFAAYNDANCPADEETKEMLRNEGVDENLAHHVAHLFIRDPIVAFNGQIELNDEESTNHFESIQSTNWQSCRWKPPPFAHAGGPHIGWRTEFRTMEAQLTDFENAAFTVFVVLITRVVLAFDLGFYIPLSKVDENMERAHLRDAITNQKFFFRRHIAPPEVNFSEGETSSDEETSVHNTDGNSNPSGCHSCSSKRRPSFSFEDSFEEMTMKEIFCGKEDYFPGLLPLVYAYLEFINCDSVTFNRVSQYLKFIEKRASGELLTPAAWMRKFVHAHPAYKQDSVISPEIAHDLMMTCQGIGEGSIPCPDLLGDITIERVRKEDAYGQVLAGRLSQQERSKLLQTLCKRATTARPENVARGKSRANTEVDLHYDSR